jgi:hypothetical protein
MAKHWVAACAVVCFAMPAVGAVKDQFVSAGTDIATKIATDPGSFLFDIHLNAEDQSPLPVGKVFSWSTNIFPNLIPFGELGLELKGQVHREHGNWPQIDVFGGGWDSLAVSIVNGASGSTDFSGSLIGYHAGFVVTESLHPRLRVFGGYEYTSIRANVSFGSGGLTSSGGSGTFSALDTLSSVNVGVSEHFLFTGAELFRTPTKRLNAEVGYGLVAKHLVLRMIWASPHFDTSLNFYPEGAWTLWPVMNFQWRY